MAKPVAPIPKKPYLSPTLTVYGTVRELTLKLGPRSKPDGGARLLHNKTQI
jgi:hypothetical protein